MPLPVKVHAKTNYIAVLETRLPQSSVGFSEKWLARMFHTSRIWRFERIGASGGNMDERSECVFRSDRMDFGIVAPNPIDRERRGQRKIRPQLEPNAVQTCLKSCW
jgi:hypothetical protein